MYDIVIIAGGLGTRLGTITSKIPKSLVDIDGNPFIYHQLKLLEEKGFEHVILCLGKYGEKVEKYVKSMDTKLKIDYSYDGETLLGTGGCVAKATDFIESAKFFTLYGDSYLPIDYEEVQNKLDFMQNVMGLMTIYKNDNPLHQNNAVLEGYRVTNYSKTNYIPEMEYLDFGLSIFYKSDLKIFKGEKFELSLWQTALANANALYGYVVDTKFYEVGSPEGLEEFKNYIKEKNNVQ